VAPVTIASDAAADLAHLLAELLENGLTYSPPDETVEVRGRSQPGSGYLLAVIDNGVGMRPDEVARANRRLAGAESFTIAPSKYLGHYVAGKLAARHGLQVVLHCGLGASPPPDRRSSTGSGVTATIGIPAELLTVLLPPPRERSWPASVAVVPPYAQPDTRPA
jgi:hypothetical protein